MGKMKHIPLLLLAAVLAVGCSQDELFDPAGEGQRPLVIKATGLSVTEAGITRATVDGSWDRYLRRVQLYRRLGWYADLFLALFLEGATDRGDGLVSLFSRVTDNGRRGCRPKYLRGLQGERRA